MPHADRGPRGTAQHRGHTLFAFFRLAIWFVCVARVIAPEIDVFLGPIEVLTTPAVIAAGLGLLLVSLCGTVYVHSYMGAAWRSGVGRDAPRRLITTGPFRFTRHPLFVVIALGQFGFFLALPSLFSLGCLAIGVGVLVAQARFEEGRLARAFGASWSEYVRLTPALPLPRRAPR